MCLIVSQACAAPSCLQNSVFLCVCVCGSWALNKFQLLGRLFAHRNSLKRKEKKKKEKSGSWRRERKKRQQIQPDGAVCCMRGGIVEDTSLTEEGGEMKGEGEWD